jgi:Flp pilus assembly protein TadD
MMRWFCLLGCALFLWSGSLQAQLPEGGLSAEAKKAMEEAAKALEDKKYSEAFVKVDEAEKLAPNNASVLNLRGCIYLKKGGEAQTKGDLTQAKSDWVQADAYLKKALEIDSKSDSVRWNQAELLFVQKKYTEAVVAFEELQTRMPGTFRELAQYKVFLCYLAAGNKDKAKGLLSKFSQLSSTPAYYYANAAWNFSQNNKESAQELLSQAKRVFVPFLNDQFSDALQEIGWLPKGSTPEPKA